MKKTLSVFLAIVMMFAMCVPAFAAPAPTITAGDEVNALEGQAKIFAEVMIKGFNEGYIKLDETEKDFINYFIDNYQSFISLKDIDATTLIKVDGTGDVFDAAVAVYTDTYSIDYDGGTVADYWMANCGSDYLEGALSAGVNRAALKIQKDKILSVRVFGAKCNKLSDAPRRMAALMCEAMNNGSYNIKDAEGRKALAKYVFDNFDKNASDTDITLAKYYEAYKENKELVAGDAEIAVNAFWDDNELAFKHTGSANENDDIKKDTETKENWTVALAEPFEKHFSDLEKAEKREQFKKKLDEFLKGFTGGDIDSMFGGFSDALKQIGGAVSGLLGGIFGGGGSDMLPGGNGSGNDEDFENTKTGDVALYSVLGLTAVAGAALVLTRKKHDDK